MSWNPEKVLAALRECVQNVNDNRNALSINTKYDKSLVTNIDKSNEAILQRHLEHDGDFFLGEESVSNMTQERFDELLQGNAYIVDPIDGTAPFAHRLPLWAISVGYCEHGNMTNGCIVLPDLHEAYISSGDDVLFTKDISTPLNQWKKLMPPTLEWNMGAMIITGQSFTKQHKLFFDNPVLSPGSAVQAFSTLLSGKVIAYVGIMKVWDVAGSIPLLNRMGFRLCLRDNGKIFTGKLSKEFFDLSFPNPSWSFVSDIVCAMPQNHAPFESLLAKEISSQITQVH